MTNKEMHTFITSTAWTALLLTMECPEVKLRPDMSNNEHESDDEVDIEGSLGLNGDNANGVGFDGNIESIKSIERSPLCNAYTISYNLIMKVR